jgi:hypothetical protein
MGVGDQIRAYANNNLVSATNIVQEHIDGTHPIDLVAPSSLSEYAPYIIPAEGYVKDSDVIELTYVRNGVEYEGTLNVIEGSSQYDGLFTSGTLDISIVQATEFGISGNYPNPFNPTTTIEYNVEISGHVTLKIYDIMGRVVTTLVDEYKDSGRSNYRVIWDGKDKRGQQVSAGLYLYTLKSNGRTDHAKMVLMK